MKGVQLLMGFRRRALVATAVLLASSAACSEGEERARTDPDFLASLTEDIGDARAAGATDEQVAILESARESGEISFEAYNEAVDRSLRCMRELGVAVKDHGIIEHMGVRMRDYSVPGDAEEADGQEPIPGYSVHRCVAEHSFWVNMVYQLQPSSLEAREQRFEQYRPAIVDCLAEHGIEVEPDLSEHEMFQHFTGDEKEIYGSCQAESGYIPTG